MYKSTFSFKALSSTKMYSSLLIGATLTVYFISAIFLCGYFIKYAMPESRNGYPFIKPLGASGECEISDFTLIYAAGLLNRERISKNANINVYDPFLLTQSVERITAPLHPLEFYCIQYPPMLYALSTPLAHLSLYNAWLGIVGISLLCIVITVLAAVGNLSLLVSGYWLSIFPCLASVPLIFLIRVGQTSAIETAIITLAFQLLCKNKYFWAGLVAGAALFKVQFAPIIFIPGIVLGKIRFLNGWLLMCVLEALLSICIVGWNNTFNFVLANYLCEISHTYAGLNDSFTMMNLRAILESFPLTISNTNLLAGGFYVLLSFLNILLWIKIYPSLKKIPKNSFELIASITVISLLISTLHAYQYDYLLLIPACIWLFKWATEKTNLRSTLLEIIKVITVLIIILLPVLTWINLSLTSSDIITLHNNIRMISICLVLLFLAIIGVFLELRTANYSSQSSEEI